MKISEILRKAADRQLDDGSNTGDIYSCRAVETVETGNRYNNPRATKACKFLASLGLDCNSLTEFSEFPRGETRQGARFLWLDFAALVAEDEGL